MTNPPEGAGQHPGWGQPGQSHDPTQPVPGYPGPAYPGPAYPAPSYLAPSYPTPVYGPPWYGWPAPPPAPAPRRRTGLIASIVAVLAVAAAAALVLSMNLGARVLDRAAVQRSVAAQFQQTQGVAVQVTCDQSMKLVQGATYQCRATAANGASAPLLIRITDAGTGRYTWGATG
jgi:Domain of unknown function (DUF4333)